MYEDDPQEKVFDMLGRGGVRRQIPLGRAIIGRAQVISEHPGGGDRTLSPRPLPARERRHRRRRAPSITTCWWPWPRECCGPPSAANGGRPPAPTPAHHAAVGARAPGRRFERKDTEQYHVCLGGTGLSRHDDRRFALRVLDTIFGGTSSSRLFQEVRERRGLAYSVYSFTSAYSDTGQVGLYVGTRADNLVQALSRAWAPSSIASASEPATAEELSRAKENLKGRVVLALESTGSTDEPARLRGPGRRRR